MSHLDQLTETLSRLPGIGSKSARRLVYHLLKTDDDFLNNLADQLSLLKKVVRTCPVCGYYSEEDECAICSDTGRSRQIICVVEQAQDAANIELTGAYRGLYHILGGAVAPLDGVSPEDLQIDSLLDRLHNDEVKEIIIATNLTMEGDATALYLQNLLKNYSLHVTRIAGGLPVGSGLEYADRQSLARSISGRRTF